jgi:glycosyltransferase involved in cell wall biosynthesis
MLTVLTPVKDPNKWLSSYLDWSSSLPDWVEIIVIVNAAYFNSLDWVNLDKRHRVISSNDNGMYTALNIGLRNALNDYVSYVNIDDYLDVEYFVRLFPILETGSHDFIYTDYILHYGSNKKRYYKSLGKYFVKSRHHLFTSQQGVVWRKSDLEFDVRLKYCADTLFFIKYLDRVSRNRVLHISGYFAVFRIHDSNLSNNTALHFAEHEVFIGNKDYSFTLFSWLRRLKNIYNTLKWYYI